MSDTGNSNKFFTGLLTGAAIGSVFALLYAPEKGTDVRDKVAYRLKNLLEELNQLQAKITKEKQEFMSDAKNKGEAVVQDAQHRAEDLINEAEELLRKINQEEI